VNFDGRFGANSIRQHIGIGSAEKIELVDVYRPTTDTTRTIVNPQVNTVLQIREDGTD